jgi:hypothetical protein
MKGFSFVIPIMGLNRLNTGKEEDDDDDTRPRELLSCLRFFEVFLRPYW